MKTLYYSFPELSIKSRMFCISNSCKSIEDIKKEIALNCNIKRKYIIITNPPREEINLIRDYYHFEIKYNASNHDITISIPDFKTIIIKNGYLLKLEEIFPRIAKEGQHYSAKCIQNNIQLILSGKDVSSENYPFLSPNNNLTYTIQLQGDTVTLKYRQNQFTISNNESFSVAQNLIGKAYPSFNITVTDSKGKNPTELKSSERYQVNVRKNVKFIDVDSHASTYIELEFPSTASDAQKLLSTRLKYTNDYPKPEDFVIYKIDQKLIDDLSKPLMLFQNLNQNFFYKIKREKRISQEEKEPIIINSIREKEPNNIQETKTFKYTIRELFIFSKLIKIDINQYQTPDDLKSLIASDIKVSDEELQFMNPISEQLKNIPQYTEFKIEFHSLHPDIDVFISKGQKICIKNFYKMKIKDILNSIANEGIFYSNECIKRNLHICLLGEEIAPDRFPIFSIPKDAFLEIKFSGQTVTLKYDKFQFTFSDNQTIDEARGLFQKIFPGFSSSIKDSRGNYAKHLKSTEKYFLRVEKLVSFNDIDHHLSSTNIFVDYVESVSAVQKKLAEEYKLCINPERIIIYDKNKTPISDKNKPLSSFQNLDQVFRYRIDKEGEISEDKSDIKLIKPRIKTPGRDRESDVEISSQPEKDHKKTSDEDTTSKRYIKIIFIFTKRCGNFYPMREDISLDSTIGDIIEMIKKTHNIKDKINIKANEIMKPFNPKQTIEEIEEFIKDEENIGNIENTLYVDIETKTSKEFQQPDVKRKSKYDEDDEDEKLNKISTTIHDKDEKNKSSITTGDWTPKDKKGKLSNPIRKHENPVAKATPEKKEAHSEKDEFKIETKSSKKNRSSSVSRFKPKVTNIPESPDTCKQIKKQVDYSTSNYYKFEFNGETKQIKLMDDSSIESQETMIKKQLKIEEEEQITFTFIGEDEEYPEDISNTNQKIRKYKNGTIRICTATKPKMTVKVGIRKKLKPSIKPLLEPESSPPSSPKEKPKESSSSESEDKSLPKVKPKPKLKEKPKEKEKPTSSSDLEIESPKEETSTNKIKYNCQIGNDENDVEVIELGPEATVQTMKEYIGRIRDVKDISSIKVTFAGKELLSDIKLGPMKIGETKLFIYIPITGDILLMTAKALQYRKEDVDDESSNSEPDEIGKEDEKDGDDDDDEIKDKKVESSNEKPNKKPPISKFKPSKKPS